MRTVYLDNNATTMVAPEAVEAMRPLWCDLYGNASSMHSFGGQVASYITGAREQVAALVGADPAEIVFTSGGSESDNLAIKGTLDAFDGAKRHVVTTRVEHPAVLGLVRHLSQRGYRVTELPVDPDGSLDLGLLDRSITPDTAIVSVMWANNETGVVFPIPQIADIVKSRGVVFHTDAVQAAGKMPIDLAKVPVDLLSISGHKLHAPKGIGVLYVRKGTRLMPQVIGGHHESNRRAGTENVPGIVGLGMAAELARAQLPNEHRITALRDRLEAGILASCPGVRINGANRLPNTLNVSFEFVEGEAILLMLDDLGIAASSGSACASGSLQPSHVLRAMGVPFTFAHGSIRFSLSRYTTGEEIDFVLRHLPGIIERLREISPFAKDGEFERALAADHV
ncbi:cysteine desulfurase NifS [Candidatus Fermentibacteria bacterium]|nr:cysteine desulfurase NifS [Candidatus Fermentibacteria bacterium]